MKNTVIASLSFSVFVSVFLFSCQNEEYLIYQRYYAQGKVVYEQRCQNCHGKSGEGLGNLMPPLTDSSYLKKNEAKLSCIIKNGLKGPILVSNKLYDTAMPAEPHLSNIEIAEVITYITNSFGNKQGLRELQQVEADLAKCDEGDSSAN